MGQGDIAIHATSPMVRMSFIAVSIRPSGLFARFWAVDARDGVWEWAGEAEDVGGGSPCQSSFTVGERR